MSAKSIHVGPDVTPKGHRTGKTRVTIPGGPKGNHTRTRVFDTPAQANDFASRLGKRAGIRVELSGRASGSTERFEKGARVLVRNAKDLQGVVHAVIEGVVVRQKKDGFVTIRYFDPSEETEAYKDVSPSRLERISGRASGLAKSARSTPWRGEYENERVHGHVRLKLIHLKLWGVEGRSPAPARCAVTSAAAFQTLDGAVATIAGLDAQAAPPSKRRWKKAMVTELTRLLGEAQAVVEGKKPIGLVRSATEMADLIAASRRKQGLSNDNLSTPILRNIARLVGAGGVCGLEDLVVEIYQQKYMHEGRARS